MMTAGMQRILFRVMTIVLCGMVATNVPGQPAEGHPRDILVFKDGDRIQGRLVEQLGTILIFQSDRFGELRVSTNQAVVIKADKPVAPAPTAIIGAPVTPAQGEKKAAERAEAEKISGWAYFSPAVLAASLRNTFGPWHGRLAFSTEVVSDTADRGTLSVDAQLKRKWTSDEVQLNGRYDYSETNTITTATKLTTTDMVKGDGLWRHDFSKSNFAQYRPTLEWNRANFHAGAPADYVLLHQEIGAGITLITKPARKLRIGLSENLFDVWTTPAPASHDARTSESAFVETELKLPWGLQLTDRGIYYYSFSSQADGWENRVEVTKKFTEALSTAIRHEIRRGSPDGTAQDYTRLKLLLGLDF
jgi:hypothetical protein